MSLFTYENDTPLEIAAVVLDLLDPRWGDNSTRHISLWPHAPPHVEIGHHHEHSDSDYRRFLVAKACVDRLLASRLLKGKPEWGYTDMHELSLSDAGKREIRRLREEYGVDALHTHAEHWLERWRRK